MELVQSTRQHLICRSARLLHDTGIYLVGAGILMHLGMKAGMLSWVALYVVVIPPVLMTAWLLIFNTGKVAVPEHVLRLDHAGIRHVRPGESELVEWNDYLDYRVRGWPWRRVALRSRTGNPITFDYLTFSREQRDALFRFLDAVPRAS
jgi:hypothetical protein